MAFTKVTLTGVSEVLKTGWERFNTLIDDLLSTSSGKGASQIGIEDAGNKYTATTVEDALQEIHAAVTVSTPISLTGQALSLVNDTLTPVTEIDTGTLANSDTVIPTSKTVTTSLAAKMNLTGSNLAIGSDADGDTYFRAAGVLARLAKGAANLKMFMNAGATAPEWANGMETGTITRAMDAATAAVSYTGIGFKPSLLFLMAASPLSTSWSIGFSLTGSTSFNMRGWGATFAPESGVTLLLLLAEDAAQTKYQVAAMTSFDTDGFTLSWTRTGATAAGTATIGYIAFR